jgi:hypothetical protein
MCGSALADKMNQFPDEDIFTNQLNYYEKRKNKK